MVMPGINDEQGAQPAEPISLTGRVESKGTRPDFWHFVQRGSNGFTGGIAALVSGIGSEYASGKPLDESPFHLTTRAIAYFAAGFAISAASAPEPRQDKHIVPLAGPILVGAGVGLYEGNPAILEHFMAAESIRHPIGTWGERGVSGIQDAALGWAIGGTIIHSDLADETGTLAGRVIKEVGLYGGRLGRNVVGNSYNSACATGKFGANAAASVYNYCTRGMFHRNK